MHCIETVHNDEDYMINKTPKDKTTYRVTCVHQAFEQLLGKCLFHRATDTVDPVNS